MPSEPLQSLGPEMDYNIPSVWIGDPTQLHIPPTWLDYLGHLDTRLANTGNTDIRPVVVRRSLGLLGSPEVLGAMTVVGKAKPIVAGAVTLIELIQGKDDPISGMLAALSSKMDELNTTMREGFNAVDHKLNDLASNMKWDYALGNTQNGADFINVAWSNFEDEVYASETTKDLIADQFNQIVAGALESQLKWFYTGLLGPDLSPTPSDRGLIDVFIEQTWENSGGYANHRTWATNLSIFYSKIQKLLVDGITLHLWALRRRRPEHYPAMRKQYKIWLANVHQKVRDSIPAPLSSMFDAALWTNYGEQRPLRFVLSSSMNGGLNLSTVVPGSGVASQQINRAVLLDSQGMYRTARQPSGPIKDWMTRSALHLRLKTGTPVSDPPRFYLGFANDIYLEPQAGRGNQDRYDGLYFNQYADDAVPLTASFALVSPSRLWSDRMVFELEFSEGSRAMCQPDQLALRDTEPQPGDFAYGGPLCVVPSPIPSYYDVRARQFTFALAAPIVPPPPPEPQAPPTPNRDFIATQVIPRVRWYSDQVYRDCLQAFAETNEDQCSVSTYNDVKCGASFGGGTVRAPDGGWYWFFQLDEKHNSWWITNVVTPPDSDDSRPLEG